MQDRMTHLQRLEAEAIHIMREVVAEAENPVMLYSIGKDSSVMLHIAMKAFYPAKPPFPIMHIDTMWKFSEMIGFRNKMAEDLGLELIVHINPEGEQMKMNPFVHGSAKHTDVMKTQGLKQALDKHGFDVAFGGARRDEENLEPRKGYFHSETKTTIGTQKGRGQNFGMSTTLAKIQEKPSGFPAFKLDRIGYLAVHSSGKNPNRAIVLG